MNISHRKDGHPMRRVPFLLVGISQVAGRTRSALVNGAAGIVAFDQHGEPMSVMGFIVTHGTIVGIDVLGDPVRLRQLDLAVLND